ncbi:MAG: methyltransferase domain-containing protein [Dehalococcoidia bacterium]
MTLPSNLDLASCCSLAYSHPAARWLLGDSFHPGGLGLTSRLAQRLGIDAGARVLDAGCGRGASAVHLARTIGCRVVGVTLETELVEAARAKAQQEGVQELATFVQGDLYETPLEKERFDAAIMECVLSILPDKEGALRLVAEALRPGGRVGLTDVTVSGPLPPELQGVLAVAGCVGDARSLADYRDLATAAGLTIEHTEDLRETAAQFLKDIKGKMLIAEIGAKLGKLPIGVGLVEQARGLLSKTQELVQQGALSYGMVVARKPA